MFLTCEIDIFCDDDKRRSINEHVSRMAKQCICSRLAAKNQRISCDRTSYGDSDVWRQLAINLAADEDEGALLNHGII